MEIAKLYETAAENLEKAIEVCGKSKINLSSLTVIASASGNVFSGINWKTLNDSYEEEPTTSEEEAILKMLLAGETAIESIVKLDAETKLPVDPEQKYLELIIKLNHENVKSNVLQGKNSKVILTSVNSEIAKFAEQFAPAAPAEETKGAQNGAANPQGAPELGPNEPEGSAAHAGIDASGLQMIFDDWESSADKADAENKPFNGNTLSSDKAEVINQVQNMAGNGFQQQNSMYGQQPMQQGQNGMYGGQPMQQGMYQQQGGMYGGPMQGGMYGQGGMNGMYQQQSVNMYGGQPMQQQGGGMYGGPMQQGMYGQPMYGGQGGMYGGPMQQQGQGMYGQQGQGMYGQQQNAGRQSLYLNPAANQQQANYNMPGAATSAYRSKLQAPVRTSVVNTQSVSVYGTNIGEGDNNAIFKDRLNDILNSSSSATSTKADENDKLDVMMSAKEKKNAAKKDAKNH